MPVKSQSSTQLLTTGSITNFRLLPGSISLPKLQPKDPAKKRFQEATLLEFVDKSEEVVIYGGVIDDVDELAPFACAQAVTWGFTRVYYFSGGLKAWYEAGQPVETVE